MTAALELREIRAGYGPIEVLHSLSLAIPPGSITALLGPNGAGKTTLLSVVAGLIPIRDGDIVWNGEVINHEPPHRRARSGLMLIPERRGIFPALSVRDNLEVFAGSHTGFDVAFDSFPVLRERIAQRAGLLSGGEQQMLAMSRALLRRPKLLLLDEISIGLAPRVTRALFDVISGLACAGTAIVLVEQHLSDALRLADVVYVMSRGELVFAGEPGELANGIPPGYVSVG